MSDYDAIHDSLKALRDSLPPVLRRLGAQPPVDLASWTGVLDSRLLPRLAPDFPLLAAICGGGSTGKSTLFNSLLGESLSPAGGKAGINRRVLAAVHPEILRDETSLANLFEPFGELPRALEQQSHLTQPGGPLYVRHKGVPPNIVLLDTPDFDTGLKGEYVNRPLAKPVLEACDVLVYIFTNATYNNRDNTAFMADVLTSVGKRKCMLVYRCYASFTDVEVYEHATVVGRNLFGEDPDDYILGIWRADDSNEVAAGTARMKPRPVWRVETGIIDTLSGLDSRETRREVNESIIADVLLKADDLCREARLSGKELSLYHDMIRLAQSHCVAASLKRFPLHEIVTRTNQIWHETSPPHVKAIRRVGRAASYPGRKVLSVARWMKKRMSDRPAPASSTEPYRKVEEDLVAAASELRREVIAGELTSRTTPDDPDGARMRATVEEIRRGRSLEAGERPYQETGGGRMTIFVDAHPSLDEIRETIRKRSWQTESGSFSRLAREICRPPEEFDDELRELIMETRANMNVSERAREYASAYLGVVPPTLALVYILGTGDPVVGAGVLAKVSGLFGLHDLAAVVALPASTGLDMASRKKLEERLRPLIERWFQSMSQRVEQHFESQITGPLLDEATAILEEVESKTAQTEAHIERCRQSGEHT